MKVSNEKWHEIVEETRAGIERWNTHAREKQKSDQFHVNVIQGASGKYEFIITKHHTEWNNDFHCVAREIATGEVRRAKYHSKNGNVEIKTPDPKAWARLADKPGAEIAKKLKLLDFIMILGSSVVPAPKQAAPL
jgi:hypothetical protein